MIATVALLGWPIVAIFVGLLTRKTSHAVAIVVLAGVLLLPNMRIDVPVLPPYDKCCSVIYASAILLLIRPHASGFGSLRITDALVAVFVLCPIATSVINGLGAWDGLSHSVERCVLWAIPYLVGRQLLGRKTELETFLRLFIFAALAYTPLVLWEANFGPHLHRSFYGVETRTFGSYVGIWGPLGWVPVVFMRIPFEVTMFLGLAVVFLSVQYAASGRSLFHPLIQWLVFMTAMSKKWSGMFLAAAGFAVLYPLIHRPRLGKCLFATLFLLVSAYPLVRTTGVWSGAVVSAVVSNVSERRAESFQTRLDNEDVLIAKAMQKPIFGWGRWGRSRVYNARGEDISLTDGLWIITLGQTGLVGLVSLYLILLAPSILLIQSWCTPNPPRRHRREHWAILAAVMATLLHAADCLINAFPLPYFPILMGAVVRAYATRDVFTRSRWRNLQRSWDVSKPRSELYQGA